MVHKKRDAVISCFECIAIKGCYGLTHPDIDREKARQLASACTSLSKGFSTETINVVGSKKGISRKKAEKMINKGEARWTDNKTIEFTKDISALKWKIC